jgi:hypothetical protein
MTVALALALAACGGTVNAGGEPGTGGTGGTGGGATREPMHHRAEPAACESGTLAGPSPTCASDAECTAGPKGRCVPPGGNGICVYQSCVADADCAAGELCECAPDGFSHRCVTANCARDSDCPNSWCSPTFGSCGSYSGVIAYACHTSKDQCTDDADCASGGGYCMFEPAVGYWLCGHGACVG